jgi:hypothetical protein
VVKDSAGCLKRFQYIDDIENREKQLAKEQHTFTTSLVTATLCGSPCSAICCDINVTQPT